MTKALETGRLPHESKEDWKQAQSDCIAIARNSARRMANKSGLQYDELESEAMYALGIAFTKRDRSYGFYSYAKQCIDGYLCNFLRDGVRPVRLPRRLADLHVAALRHTKLHPEDSDEQIAEALNRPIEDLRQVRATGCLFTNSTEDSQYGELAKTDGEVGHGSAGSDCAELALNALHAGVAVLAKRMQLAESDIMPIVARGLQNAFASRYTAEDN